MLSALNKDDAPMIVGTPIVITGIPTVASCRTVAPQYVCIPLSVKQMELHRRSSSEQDVQSTANMQSALMADATPLTIFS